MNTGGLRGAGHHTAMAVVVGFVAFLVVTSYTQVRTSSERSAERREQLAALVDARQRHAGGLERELADLRARLERESRTSVAAGLRSLEREREMIGSMAGLAPARGPGVVVELADSSDAARSDPASADHRIQDLDVQLVVNALWEAGAEAIAINGQRLIATSAIRSAGGAILVNYKVLTSPYRIRVIGDGRRLEQRFRSSSIAARFQSWVDVYGLGFSIRTERRIELPAFAGSVRMRYAQPS